MPKTTKKRKTSLAPAKIKKKKWGVGIGEEKERKENKAHKI